MGYQTLGVRRDGRIFGYVTPGASRICRAVSPSPCLSWPTDPE